MENPSCPETHNEHGTAGLQVVHLDGFSAPWTLPPDEQEAHARRFSSLFVDRTRCRQGGIGWLLYGEDVWGKPVAVKIMDDPDTARDTTSQPATRTDDMDRAVAHEAFMREYQTLRSLSGIRGFPKLYGLGRLDGRDAIVMEWIEGETLQSALRHLFVDEAGRLSPLTAAQLGRDLFALLARMDTLENSVVHRDISTSNIMIDTSRHTLEEQVDLGHFDLKLVDFGSAMLPDQRASLTQKYGVLRGATPEFAPPEMLTEDVAGIDTLRKNPAVDVYAAASVLYLLLDGRTPFDLERGGRKRSYYLQKTGRRPRSLTGAHGASANIRATLDHEASVARLVEEAVAHCGRRPSDRELARVLTAVDGQLDDLVLACLDPVQARRPTAREMEGALSSFVDSYGANVRNGLWGNPLSSRASNATRPRGRVGRAGRAGRLRIIAGGTVALAIVGVSALIRLACRTPRT